MVTGSASVDPASSSALVMALYFLGGVFSYGMVVFVHEKGSLIISELSVYPPCGSVRTDNVQESAIN